MPGDIKAPSSLVNAWTTSEVMAYDADGFGAGDGQLTAAELKSHIAGLAAQRDLLLQDGFSTGFIDAKISDARDLGKDMLDSNASVVQYLPDALMSLPVALRRRATELLTHDDIGGVGTIDQYVIDHARQRYEDMGSFGSSAMMMSAAKAKQEIAALAMALGLE